MDGLTADREADLTGGDAPGARPGAHKPGPGRAGTPAPTTPTASTTPADSGGGEDGAAVEPPRLLAGRRRWTFALLVAVGFGQAASAIAWAWLVGRIAGGLGGGAAEAGGAGALLAPLALQVPAPVPALAMPVLAWLLVLVASAAALLYAERVLAERLGQSWVADVRTSLFRRVITSPARTVGRGRSTGGTSLRMMGNLSALRRWATLGLAKIAVAVPLLAGCLVAFALIDPSVALAAGVTTACGLVATAALSPWLRSAHRAARRRQARVAAHVVERVGAPLVVQAFGRERGERRVLTRRSRKLADAQVRRARAVGATRAIGEATTLLATAAVLVAVGAAGQGAGAAAVAIAIVGVMVTPLRELTRISEYRSACAVAMRQVRAELNRPRRRLPGRTAPALPKGKGELVLEGVRINGVLAPATARVPAGSVVAVTGRNGSGKSTLLSVIAGLVPPDGGRVLLDGADIATHRTESVRGAIGLAGPHLPLMRGTIADNVRYADPKADARRLHEAVRASGLDELLAELPQGLRTPVRESGAGLSAGQQQRVALARALLPGPRLLLLDEADAHLDARAAEVVDRVIAGFPGTVIVVAHRPERLRSADVVWHLDRGLLREERREPDTAP
ncbi:ABC transporter ATP-binding protein/permease [Streptomonospora sp. S1-112]|uniref:ABC transporter ATP-binding protein/permease n=1 Tax=Streptomonospora mangrovi TaxID=2883123 RepID=A0A9X3NLY1_9ACTN|nr:ABC transporter ATP-binding protein [Streptomonospora mangrovi]MDA0564219.1 ABC transporter ATP-binding protein/permease [Streptomonospora mangrovi]